MSAILPYRNCFYKWTKYNSKQSHDTTAILISLWCALRLDQLFSTIYEKLNIWHFYEVSVVRLWWTSENHVSRYLFLEQIAHFLEGVLTFLRKAGDLIQRFSESTHIDVLNKACKMMKVRKKLNSFSSSDHAHAAGPPLHRPLVPPQLYHHHLHYLQQQSDICRIFNIFSVLTTQCHVSQRVRGFVSPPILYI